MLISVITVPIVLVMVFVLYMYFNIYIHRYIKSIYIYIYIESITVESSLYYVSKDCCELDSQRSVSVETFTNSSYRHRNRTEPLGRALSQLPCPYDRCRDRETVTEKI